MNVDDDDGNDDDRTNEQMFYNIFFLCRIEISARLRWAHVTQ